MNSEENIPDELYFPRTVDYKIWNEYLGRQLTRNEMFILQDYKAEKCMNKMMDELYEQCMKKNKLYVPMLTNLDGNCLFESLIYYNISQDVLELRKLLSLIMYIYKDYQGFLPGSELTLQELFNFQTDNEIEHVICKNKSTSDDHVYYKYTYNVMCQDLSNNHSWTRLPTQLLLLVISYVFKLEIIIIRNSSSYETVINAYESLTNKPELKTIYLGHLAEAHYVPIDIFFDDETIDPMYYNDAKNDLIEWATKMEKIQINNYLYIKKIENIKAQEKEVYAKAQLNNYESTFEDINLDKVDITDEYTVQF